MSASFPSERRGQAADFSATTAARVADELRRRILSGELRPGQRLKIDELASLCDVSHMPVREALRELHGEGVLDVLPHRGAVIRGVDRDFITNFYDVRAAIEAMLSARCARRADDAAIEALTSAAADFESANDARSRVLANRVFHETINAAANNPQALQVLAQGRVLAEALRLRFGYGGGRPEAIIAEHRALVDAVSDRDSDRAGDIAGRHCIAARDDLLSHFQ